MTMTNPNVDARSLRDIVLAIEKRLTVAKQAVVEEPPKPRHNMRPSRFDERTRDALNVVLDDIAATRRRVTYGQLIELVNQVEPGCLRGGGDVNESIRNFCAERAGIEVGWSSTTTIGKQLAELRQKALGG